LSIVRDITGGGFETRPYGRSRGLRWITPVAWTISVGVVDRP
jgi:hypothetical protein